MISKLKEPAKGKDLYDKNKLQKRLEKLSSPPSKTLLKLIRILVRTTFDPEILPADDNFMINADRWKELYLMFESLSPEEDNIMIWLFNTIGDTFPPGEEDE